VVETKRRRAPAWVTFSALRLLFFAAPLGLIYALGGSLLVAAVFAAILGLCLSVIFLGKQRSEAVGTLRATGTVKQPRRASADESAEDDVDEDGRPWGDQNASAAASPKP
jgi:uncharacterized iron-regulated membrane protein